MSTIRMRTRLNNGVTEVRAIIRHPMHTGFGVDEETKELIPAYYIRHVTIKHNDNEVMSCDWSRAVSKNPYFSFMFEGAESGDTIELSWVDTKGKTDSATSVIK